MTNELEKQFFSTFGVEPKIDCERCGVKEFASEQCYQTECEKVYPQITDHILLELICIATSSEITVEFKGIKNIEHLKEVVLNYCLERYGYCLHKDKFKHQVRTLFEEG